jgi:beta-glucanase (GH16 family)
MPRPTTSTIVGGALAVGVLLGGAVALGPAHAGAEASAAPTTTSAAATTGERSAGASFDTTVAQVPQDGDGRSRSTLATCPAVCEGNPRGERQAWLDFSVRDLPAGAVVTSAQLRLSTWEASSAQISARALTRSASGAGWSDSSAVGTVLATRSSVAKGVNTWDVTPAVRGDGTASVALTQTGRDKRTYWASAENTNTSMRPALLVTYRATTAGPTTTTSSTAPSSSSSSSTAPSSSSSSSTSTSSSTSSSTAPAGYKLVFADEFNGSTVDRSVWNVRDKTYLDFDKACISADNVVEGDGVLTLSARKATTTCGKVTRPYTSVYMETIGKKSFTYGRFEVRAKAPSGTAEGTGIWPAAWLRPDDGGHGEIDIMELPGGTRYYDKATQAIFYSYDPPTKQDNRAALPGGKVPGDGYHVYATEWDKTSMRWYVDGALVYSRDTSTTPWFAEAFSKPYHLRLTVHVGGWLGDPDASTRFPAEYKVDYFRVYQK